MLRPCPPSLINCCSANPDLLTCPNLPMQGQPFTAGSCHSALMSRVSVSYSQPWVCDGRWYPRKEQNTRWEMVPWEAASPHAWLPRLLSCPAAASVPTLTLLLSPSPHILLPLFLPPIDLLPVGLFLPRCCNLHFSQVESAWVCSPNPSKSFLCYFCPCQSVAHPPQIILMHHLLGMALMTALRVSVGAAPLPGCVG